MKRMALSVLLLAVLLLPGQHVFAKEDPGFHPALTAQEGRSGDIVDVTVPYDGGLGELGAFLVRVEYDSDAFEYLRVREASAVSAAYASTFPEDGEVCSVYTLKRKEDALSEPGETFTYRFRIRDGAEQGKRDFAVSVNQIVDPVPVALGHDADVALTYTILPPPSGDASLLSLTPDSGTLEPAFSPKHFSYAMTVPFEVKSVAFTAEPAEGAYCKVNRKNLGAGGSDTIFLITVTAEDEKTKEVYRVTVRRQERVTATPTVKPSSTPKPEKTPNPTKTPKPAAEKTPAASKAPKASADTPTTAPTAAASEAPSSAVETPSPVPIVTGNGGEGPSAPSIVIRNGEASFLPGFFAILLLVLAVLVSDPLSKWLCKKLPEKEREDEKK